MQPTLVITVLLAKKGESCVEVHMRKDVYEGLMKCTHKKSWNWVNTGAEMLCMMLNTSGDALRDGLNIVLRELLCFVCCTHLFRNFNCLKYTFQLLYTHRGATRIVASNYER